MHFLLQPFQVEIIHARGVGSSFSDFRRSPGRASYYCTLCTTSPKGRCIFAVFALGLLRDRCRKIYCCSISAFKSCVCCVTIYLVENDQPTSEHAALIIVVSSLRHLVFR